MSQPLTLNVEFYEYLREIIKYYLKGENGICFFRRFGELTSNTTPVSIRNHFAPGQYEELNTLQLQSLSAEDIDKSVEIIYPSFHGFTTTQQIREEPQEISGRPIFISSNNYGQFDFGSLGFCKTAPVTPYSNGINGDLLFIWMSSQTLKNCVGKDYHYTPKADCWGIVSEQFLRTWTLITHDWHETFDKLIPKNTPRGEKEKELKKKLFSGNRLMTNSSFLKEKLSREEAGKNMSLEEEREKYRHQRTELLSRNYVDCYAALISIVRYGELPCPLNVPNNKNSEGLTRSFWNLPENFVSKILSLVEKKWFHPTTMDEYMFFGHISDAISSGMYNVKNYIKNIEMWSDYSQSKCLLSNINKVGFVDEIARLKLPKVDKEKIENFEKNAVNKCNELQKFLELVKQKTVASPVKQKNVNITIEVEIKNKKPTAFDELFNAEWY